MADRSWYKKAFLLLGVYVKMRPSQTAKPVILLCRFVLLRENTAVHLKKKKSLIVFRSLSHKVEQIN